MDSPFAIPLILKCSLSLLSIAGSGYIIQHVVRSPQRRKKVFTRIMLGMSINDLIFAIWNATAPFQIPQEAQTPWPWAMGNWGSCISLAFFGRGGGISSFLYNGALGLYYLLSIRYGWKEWQMKRDLEVWLHVVSNGIGWSFAIAGIPLKIYNPLALGCAITGYPLGCQSRGDCTRGEHAAGYGIAFVYAWWWLVFVWLVISMSMIYTFVAKAEKTSERRSASRVEAIRIDSNSGVASDMSGTKGVQAVNSNNNKLESSPHGGGGGDDNNSKSFSSGQKKATIRRRFMNQAILYCLVFFISFFFTAVHMIIIRVEGVLMLPLTYLSASLASLIGFFNAVIYIRPRYLQQRRKQKRNRERAAAIDQGDGGNKSNEISNTLNFGSRIKAFLVAASIHAEDEEFEGWAENDNNLVSRSGILEVVHEQPPAISSEEE